MENENLLPEEEEISILTGRKVYVYDRASQLEILTDNPDTFMWLNPLSEKQLSQYRLAQLPGISSKQKFKDMLIYKESYSLPKLDKEFITVLAQMNRQYC